jgi:hypothetical protein
MSRSGGIHDRHARAKALKTKDLRSDEVQRETDAELAAIISGGGRAKIPAFGSKFSLDVINLLLAYIRQLPKK